MTTDLIDETTVHDLSNDELITQFGVEWWAADRCVSSAESKESSRVLEILRNELLRRMER